MQLGVIWASHRYKKGCEDGRKGRISVGRSQELGGIRLKDCPGRRLEKQAGERKIRRFPMKIPVVLRIVSCVSLALVAALGSSCGPLGGDSGGGNHRVVEAPGLRDLGSRLYAASNSYRRSSGKGTLKREGELDRLAQQHSESMARRGKLDHAGSSARTDEVAARFGVREKAENVMRWHVQAGKNPQAMLKSWIDSSGHRRNLLGNYAMGGLGIAQDELGNIWVTQIYAPVPGSGRTGPAVGSVW